MALAKVLADTGATVRFANQSWVQKHNLPLKKSHANWKVRVADDRTVDIVGTVTIDIDIQGYREKVTFLVMPMSQSFDLILGNDWFLHRQAVISYRDFTISLVQKGKHYTLKAKDISRSLFTRLEAPKSTDIDPSQPLTFLLNKVQAKRIIRKGATCFVLDLQHVKGSEDWTEEQFAAASTQANPKDPTPAQQEQDVRDAIRELREEVQKCDPQSGTPTPPSTTESLDPESIKLSADIEALKKEYGDDIFREELPGIRQHGEPIEAIPTIPGAKPPTRGLGRYSKNDKDELNKQISTLLKQGMIEPSLSPYAAAALIVPKYNPDGSIKGWRMVIDYRMLNNITVKFQFPMPRVDDVLDSLNGAKYFSACDATWGFWQLRLHPSDVPKTAFRTPTGLYQWRVLPFGLSNSPAVFQRTMSSFFQKAFTYPDGTTVTALGSFIQVYMDDLLIYSKTAEDHLRHLRFVFDTLKDVRIYLNPKKCEFNKPEVRFLGHLVSRNGVRPDPAKVSVMQDWPAPKNKQDLYKFLGFANYFRSFIRNYATIATLYPLTQCKNTDEFASKWNNLQQACFEAIKLALCHAPTLKMPDFDQPFEVIVDASNVAIGAVLVQDKRPVAYESKKLSPAEMRWTTTERELFAAVHALRQWQCYLRHPTQSFDLWTDHNPNTFFSKGTRPLTPRQARWQEFLGPFNFQWKYKKGQENIADTLSRPPGMEDEEAMEKAHCLIALEHSVMTIRDHYTNDLDSAHGDGPVRRPKGKRQRSHSPSPAPRKRLDFADIPLHNPLEHDQSASHDTPLLSHFDPPSRFTEFEKVVWSKRNDQFFQEGKKTQGWYQDQTGLWRTPSGALVVPTKELHKKVMQACHDSVFSGHRGKTKTLNLCQRLFYWPDMAKHIDHYIKSCPVCQSVKPPNARPFGSIRPLEVPYGKWTDVTVDMVTDLPVTPKGHDSILVFVDRLTKMCHLVPTTKTMSSEEFIRLFVDNVIKHHGAPINLISDRGSTFASKFTHTATSLMDVLQHHSTAYHPQTDGQTERMNSIMEDILRCYVATKQTEWDIHLPMAEFAINNTPSESTGQTPFILNYGVNPRHPAIAELVSKTQLGEDDIAISNPVLLDAMTVSLRNVPDIPAAARFVEDMQAAIDHTKVMIQAARARMQSQDKGSRKKAAPFQVGDQVMLSTKYIKLVYKGCPKLMPRFVGPFHITQVINPVAFKLELPRTMRIHNVFHSSLLRPFVPREDEEVHPPAIEVDGNEEYEVEILVNRRRKCHRTKRAGKHSDKKQQYRYEYLVRWKGYGPEHDEWLPEKALLPNCRKLVAAYDAKCPR